MTDDTPRAPDGRFDTSIRPTPVDLPTNDSLAGVLRDLMRTDPDTNVVLGNFPKGEAEDWAAGVTFAEAIDSPVMLRFVNLTHMARRAEHGHLLKTVVEALKALGKAGAEAKAGFFQRIRGGN